MALGSVLISQFLVISACICFVISEIVNTSCVRKCCSQGSIISLETNRCISVNETNYELSHSYNVCFNKKFKCNESKVPLPIPPDMFEISENYTLEYSYGNKSVFYSTEDFCLEIVDGGENATIAVVCNNQPKKNNSITLGEKISTRCTSTFCSYNTLYSEDFQNSSKTTGNVSLPFKNIGPFKNKVAFTLESNSFTIKNHFLKYEFDNQAAFFSSNDFCVLQSNLKNLSALVCVETPEIGVFSGFNLSSSDECFTKCCDHRSTFSHNKSVCIDKHTNVRLPEINVCRETRKHHGKECMDNKVNVVMPDTMITLTENYTLVFSVAGKSKLFEKDDFCIEYDEENQKRFAFVCVEDNRLNWEKTATGMIISMPFLLLTFIAYALLPDRNLHMKALMIYVINLMMGYLLLVIIQLSEIKFGDEVCTAMGYFCVFFFLVSFFWMNVICIDIWFAFSGLRGFSGSKKSAERKRFYMYCGYAFGMPVLHVLIVRLIDSTVGENSDFKPGIGYGQCFLKRGLAELLYFYGPMAVLISINIILFTITAFKIRSVKKETSVLKKEDSKRHSYENDKQTFNLYLKLLFAMGINWSMEIISWAVIWAGNAPDAIWYLTDFCNAIYGVFIFFIFVFKRSIWKLLKKRYYSFVGKTHLAHSLTMTNTTRVTSYSVTNSSVHENPQGGATDTSTLTRED